MENILRAAKAGQPHMIVEGKGGKERLVALGRPALAAVAEHLAARASMLPKHEAQREKAARWLFPSASAADGKLTRRRVAQILEAAAVKAGIDPAQYLGLAFKHRFLQPMDGTDREANTRSAIAYCKANPAWRLSLQTHKMLGIP